MQCSSALCCFPNHRLPLLKVPTLRMNRALEDEQNRTQKQRGKGASIEAEGSPKLITSSSNPFVKHCVKLRQSSSYRHTHGSVLVVGTTPIREINGFQRSLLERTSTTDCLILLEGAAFPEELDDNAVPIVHVSTSVMNKLSGMESSESTEAVAVMRIPTTFHSIVHKQNEYAFRRWFSSLHRILVLDGIQDPGNLGTLLRSAVAFNWGGVFLLPGCCDPFNDKALRASRGASFQLPIVAGDWMHLKSLQKEFGMKTLAGHPQHDDEVHKPVSELCQEFAHSLLDEPLCFVLGSEGRGLSEKSESECELVSIPMTGRFESLNVSVAGGIFMFMLQPRKFRVNLK